MTTRFENPKDPADEIVAEFDFTATGLVSVSAPTVTATVRWAGGDVDPTPSAIVDGAAQVVESLKVRQRIVGGLDLHDYALRCEATGSDGNNVTLGAVLMVRRQPI